MKTQLTLRILLATAFLLTAIAIHAEAHCPGNVHGLQPRIVANALLVIPVKVNGSGPYDFIVDTGSELNVTDPALAAQLKLKSQGQVGLIAATTSFRASVVVLDSLETGSRNIPNAIATVQDLGPIQAADPRIRGVLGENFLRHFDLLIDYPHHLLCLDDTRLMQTRLRGEPVPLVQPKDEDTNSEFSDRLVVSVNLAAASRPVLLQVDSGSDGPVLYGGKKDFLEPLLKRAQLQGPEVGHARSAFALLPSQDMTLGSRTVRKVPFVTPAKASLNPDRKEDGILPTVLFQRVFVNRADRYIIFDPK
jgi:hypothetical protein